MSLEEIISTGIAMIKPDSLEDAIINNTDLVSKDALVVLLNYLKIQNKRFLTNLLEIIDELTIDSVLEYVAFKNSKLFESMVILSEEGFEVGLFFENLFERYRAIVKAMVKKILEAKYHV